MAAHKRSGRKPVPGGRQISFWTHDRKVVEFDRAAKAAGVSRSQWLDAVAVAAAKT